MATHEVAIAKHATLSAATVDTITLTSPYPRVEVVNRDGASAIYFTVNGATPTVAGDNTYVLPAAIGSFELKSNAGSTVVVKLISAGTPAYSVQGLPRGT